MTNVFLCAGLRTPFGRHGGVLATVRCDDLAALAEVIELSAALQPSKERRLEASLSSVDNTAWVYDYTEDAVFESSGYLVQGRAALLEMARSMTPLSNVSIRALRTEGSAGPKLFCLSGHVERPGVYEVPFGTTLRELSAAADAALYDRLHALEQLRVTVERVVDDLDARTGGPQPVRQGQGPVPPPVRRAHHDQHRQPLDLVLGNRDIARFEPALHETGSLLDPLGTGGVVADQLLCEQLLVHRTNPAGCSASRPLTALAVNGSPPEHFRSPSAPIDARWRRSGTPWQPDPRRRP